MIILGLIKRFHERGYRYLTIFGKVLMAPGYIAVVLGMLVLSVVEFFVFDLLWLLMYFIEDISVNENEPYSLSDLVIAIKWLMW